MFNTVKLNTGLTVDSIEQPNVLLLGCLITTIHSQVKSLSSRVKSIFSIKLVFVFLELWGQHDRIWRKKLEYIGV